MRGLISVGRYARDAGEGHDRMQDAEEEFSAPRRSLASSGPDRSFRRGHDIHSGSGESQGGEGAGPEATVQN